MATSPTVLVGSSSAPIPAPLAIPASPPVLPVLIAAVVGVLFAVLGVGGVVYYLARTGKLSMQGVQTGKTASIAPTAQIETHAIVLEPLLVNLADAGGSSYLRIALTLRVADAADKKGAKKEEKSKDDTNETSAAIRDTTLTVLGRQTAENLLAADGKEHLKVELKSALAEHNSDLKVTEIFFTDFLVQR